ncbi:LOW QUALITY PROTEIN: glutamate decarboxylase 1-like [Monodon monoceros]|uniref:LOW QUALITY PROTEIN: glutamate decarboxylase 1-like n=1 Tax=Monodon monoceros TaxID=40151 RepID=UPI0010F8036B|nr:LOW QUALITY PROTEIN: glutamate decarboxylase 1-like [Monodon monoceros]
MGMAEHVTPDTGWMRSQQFINHKHSQPGGGGHPSRAGPHWAALGNRAINKGLEEMGSGPSKSKTFSNCHLIIASSLFSGTLFNQAFVTIAVLAKVTIDRPLPHDRKQMRKKSVHPFQSADKDAKKEAHTENLMTNLSNAYASDLLPSKDGKDLTKCFLLQVVNILLHYIEKTFDVKSKILDFHHPHQLLEGLDRFDLILSDHPESLEQLLGYCTDTLKYGVKTGHPCYFNQLSSGLDVIGLAGEWLTATANTNMFTYEIAPVFTVMETILLKKTCEIIGWRETEADGIFSPGGSISNLYGILVARYRQYPEIKTKGMTALPCIVLFVSEQGQYSVKKSAAILGMGTDNVIEAKCDERGKMIPAELEKNILQTKRKGQTPFCVTATAGSSTVFGACDPLHDITGICEMHKLWMRVDAACGGGLLLSRNHSYKLSGIERANSVTWNPHKLMGIPLQCSAILTGEKGTYGFEAQINRYMELAKYFYKVLKRKDNFKLVFDAKGNYYQLRVEYTFTESELFPGDTHTHSPESRPSQRSAHAPGWRIAPKIKAQMIEEGTAMLNYQPYGDKVNFFRMVFSNPATRQTDVDYVIDEIERLGKDL